MATMGGSSFSSVKNKNEFLFVAAIDIGTTFSSYAFSFKFNYQADPFNVSTNRPWSSGSMASLSLKSPTIILFDEHKKFHSFGLEAENDYSELAMDDEHHKWHLFKRFKTRLYDSEITRKMEIEDDNGKTMLAIDIIGATIKYLIDHLLNRLIKAGTEINCGDTHWVLTVPAIWSDSVKQFMRESAYKAGIHEGQLSLVIKPEAASLYFQMTPEDKIHGSEGAKFGATSPGTKHMVIDLGDKSSCFTVQERLNDGGFKEIHTRRVAKGSNIVNEEFKSMIVKIMGGTFLSKYLDENECDHLDWQRELETKKRITTPKTSGKITLKSPVALFMAYESESGETVMEAIDSSAYAGKISWVADRMLKSLKAFSNHVQIK